MSTRREPPVERIHLLDAPPRAENILDQREITIQSYRANIPFDHETLEARLGGAWLELDRPLGVFARLDLGTADALHVVLGLQDDLAVRTYDYDARRPLWYAWQKVIVETVGIHYYRDEEDFLRFQTTGGGRRITEDRLHEFNALFLGIPRAAVSKQQFDLDKIRELCFGRFVSQLYKVRFGDPAAKEYDTIEHAEFSSRRPIDPETERLKEIRGDPQVKIESFDSDVTIRGKDLAEPVQVRFFIRGLSGSLRLRFPKINYKNQLTSEGEQVRVFYSLVDAAVSSVLDADYYTQQRRSLDELEKLTPNLQLFPDLIDLAPYREVLTSAAARKELITGLDVGAHSTQWQPHLWALDELVVADAVAADLAELVAGRVRSEPGPVVRLLAACQGDAKMQRVGAVVAGGVGGVLQAIPAEMRAYVETALLSWALDREEAWDVDPASGEIRVMNLRWQIEDLSVDVWPDVIWKLATVIDAQLRETKGDAAALLAKYAWCVDAAGGLPEYHSKLPAALRLVATGRVPTSVSQASKVLKEPVADLRALDEQIKAQFSLSLWPLLSATGAKDAVVIRNDGIGSALSMEARPAGMLFADKDAPAPTDLLATATVSLQLKGRPAAIDVTFEKFGARHRVTLPVAGAAEASVAPAGRLALHARLNRKRLAAAREHRKAIDPGAIVVGSSPALLDVFARIHQANRNGGAAPVLILGERGSGKTHIVKLLHNHSSRSSGPFVERNAGGGGGDPTMQRGEWIGYGKNHGLREIEKNGRPGLLMNADRGTLFVDELAGLSEDMQYIFLSVLEGRPVPKVGGDSFVPNVRCIFATNADLDEATASGRLRPDLLDRITVKIHMPPLRERRGDILLLAQRFAGDHRITERCRVALVRHDWPGNVRELEKALELAVAVMETDEAATIDLEHFELPAEVVAAAEALDEKDGRRELWTLADEIARSEGFEHRDGLQKRAAEIMGVKQPQASKMYAEFGLAGADDAGDASLAN